MEAASWWAVIATGVLFTGSHSVLISLSKDAAGRIPFQGASVVACQELAKLLICTVLHMAGGRGQRLPSVAGGHLQPAFLLYALPAASYAINNNLAVFLQTQMDPATFQILCNLKIGTTAVMYRLLLGRPMRSQQWWALSLLCAAAMLSTAGSLAADPRQAASERATHITSLGLFLIIAYCINSGFSGVFTEYIMKKHPALTVYYQGILLYSFGSVVNVGGFLFSTEEASSFFEGFGPLVWLIIITQAVNGLIFATIMKHASNILRLFVIAGAMLVATALAWLVLGLRLTWHFWAAALLMVAATAIYYSPADAEGLLSSLRWVQRELTRTWHTILAKVTRRRTRSGVSRSISLSANGGGGDGEDNGGDGDEDKRGHKHVV
eukprot:m.43656 g.43656  ORF g.43656 m.43656 type:complete len:380 (+) comp12245_c1_seq2:107-1246(+)